MSNESDHDELKHEPLDLTKENQIWGLGPALKMPTSTTSPYAFASAGDRRRHHRSRTMFHPDSKISTAEDDNEKYVEENITMLANQDAKQVAPLNSDQDDSQDFGKKSLAELSADSKSEADKTEDEMGDDIPDFMRAGHILTSDGWFPSSLVDWPKGPHSQRQVSPDAHELGYDVVSHSDKEEAIRENTKTNS